MTAIADRDLCIGCGLCVSACPGEFGMDAGDKAQAVADTTDESRDGVREAIDGCPVSAISE